jgi:CRP/FNR family cyclic AMP-dependent transcriptional regulator
MPSSGSSSFLLIESCLKCEHRETGLFCNLPGEALHTLMNSRQGRMYPPGALICQEGQPAKGVFVLCSGKAQISTTTPEGVTTVLREVKPGEILGVSAVLGGTHYKTTAVVTEQCQLNFIEKQEFLKMLEDSTVIGSRVVEQILHDSGHACAELALMEVSGTLPQKLAQLLLRWAKHPLHVLKKKSNEIPFRVTATLEEIAQLTGAPAGEVEESLKAFQKKKWLRIDGKTWTILNKAGLEGIGETK